MTAAENPPGPPIEAGRMREQLLAVTERATRSGALQPIATRSTLVADGGVDFVVRIISSLARKNEAAIRLRLAGRLDVNPFMPYDAALHLGDLTATHAAVLNRFNVVSHHLLLVTRAFEHQEQMLTLEDLEAAWTCLRELDGLVFYNGGVKAGASQLHKHLQWIPLPLTDRPPDWPLEVLLEGEFRRYTPERPAWARGPELGWTEGLPFVHAIARADDLARADARDAADETLRLYYRMLVATGLGPGRPDGRQPGPYNLLLTRRWIVLVPRTREHCGKISINALGYAGSLLVRNQRQLDALRALGPMEALARVGVRREQL
jgi:ATP adenylyltransferase